MFRRRAEIKGLQKAIAEIYAVRHNSSGLKKLCGTFISGDFCRTIRSSLTVFSPFTTCDHAMASHGKGGHQFQRNKTIGMIRITVIRYRT